MLEQISTATEITELANSTYAARINGGNIQSGFRPDADGQNGRGYAAIMGAIEGGAEVTPYVAHVDTPEELLAQLDRAVSRDLEDVLDVMTADQKENFLMKTDGLKIDRRIALDRKIEIRAKL